MEAASTKLTRALIIFVIAIFLIKNASTSGIFKSKYYKTKGYQVTIPEGWKTVKKQKGVIYPEGVDVAMFVPEEIDVEQENPDIFITIFSKKLTTPIWVEDEFPQILQSISNSGYQIKDKGEIKLDDKITEWVVYYDKKTPALVLEFYMVTDNNMFYKIQYSAHPDKFNVQRKSFEELKDSFKLRFSLY